MLKNYFKTAVRNLLKYKVITAINVIGFAIGIAAGFIVLLFVLREKSVDTYNEHLDNTYLVTIYRDVIAETEERTIYPLAATLKENFPEIDKVARVRNFKGSIEQDGKIIESVPLRSVDPEIFNILTLPVIHGNKEKMLPTPNSVVISEDASMKYFGTENPVGKSLSVKLASGLHEFIVSTVMKNIPSESTLHGDLFFDISIVVNEDEAWMRDILDVYYTYILIHDNVDINALNNKILEYGKKKYKANLTPIPLKEIYLNYAGIADGRMAKGNISQVRIYSSIAVLLLLIACINYIILSTGIANLRTKEIGIRKVMGANRKDIILQTMSESVIVAFITLPLAFIFIELGLPLISGLLGEEIKADFFNNISYISLFVIITFLVGIISGSYISFIQSKYHPSDLLKNKIRTGNKKGIFRKALVSFQMIIFIGLLFASITVFNQMHYLYTKDSGFNKENILAFYPEGKVMKNRFQIFKQKLKENPNVISATCVSHGPAEDGGLVGLLSAVNDPAKKVRTYRILADYDFINTMQLKLVKGRNFYPDENTNGKVIINESAVKELGYKNPIGEKFDRMYEIVGVVKDFNLHSLRESISPLCIIGTREIVDEVFVKVKPENINETFASLKKISEDFNEGKIMKCEFFDDRIVGLYTKEEKFSNVIAFFTGITIFVAGLGLFGMSWFIAQQRTKEISIRKVLGASTSRIIYMVAKEFLIIALISCVIIIPIAKYLVDGWLQNFAYRSSADIKIMIATAFCALIVIFITTGSRLWRAVSVNPVDNLRQD